MTHHNNNIKNIQNELKAQLTDKLKLFFGEFGNQSLKTQFKSDRTLVSEVDHFVSERLKLALAKNDHYKSFSFYSEEDYKELLFPAVVLDPIDGTRELIMGRAECAVSLALMKSSKLDDPDNYAWLFNPFSGFEIDSSQHFLKSSNRSQKKWLGLVSRTEFEKGYFNHLLSVDQKIDISPRGSIAFKLGLLASGACDFVLSLSDKNIWDIAAGTLLCHERGYYLYQNGVRIKELNNSTINGPLLWAAEDIADELIDKFNIEKSNLIKK